VVTWLESVIAFVSISSSGLMPNRSATISIVSPGWSTYTRSTGRVSLRESERGGVAGFEITGLPVGSIDPGAFTTFVAEGRGLGVDVAVTVVINGSDVLSTIETAALPPNSVGAELPRTKLTSTTNATTATVGIRMVRFCPLGVLPRIADYTSEHFRLADLPEV
jgi:hypothetical protein